MTTSAAEKQSNPYNVQVGQVWESTDRREPGRRVRVIRVLAQHAEVEAVSAPTNSRRASAFVPGRKTEIRLDRFRSGSSGYKLVPAS